MTALHGPSAPYEPEAFPWELPPLDSWFIVCLNHQVHYIDGHKKTGVFCCMTKGTRCIEAHGPNAHAVFRALATKATQLSQAGLS